MNYLKKLQKKKFGEMLIEEGLIQETDLRRALAIQDKTGEMLGEILMNEGLISETDIARIIVKQYGLPFVLTTKCRIPQEVKSIFPPKFLHENLIVPLDLFDDIVTLAIGRISALDFVGEIRDKYRKEPFIYVGLISDIRDTLKREFPSPFTEFDGLLFDVKESMKKVAPKTIERSKPHAH
jgi:hypothetical protein